MKGSPPPSLWSHSFWRGVTVTGVGAGAGAATRVAATGGAAGAGAGAVSASARARSESSRLRSKQAPPRKPPSRRNISWVSSRRLRRTAASISSPARGFTAKVEA